MICCSGRSLLILWLSTGQEARCCAFGPRVEKHVSLLRLGALLLHAVISVYTVVDDDQATF